MTLQEKYINNKEFEELLENAKSSAKIDLGMLNYHGNIDISEIAKKYIDIVEKLHELYFKEIKND